MASAGLGGSVSGSVLFDSLQPMDCSRLRPARLLSPWDSPGKDAGVGCHSLLQGIFPTQGSNLDLLHCRQTLYLLSHRGSWPWGLQQTGRKAKWQDSVLVPFWAEEMGQGTEERKLSGAQEDRGPGVSCGYAWTVWAALSLALRPEGLSLLPCWFREPCPLVGRGRVLVGWELGSLPFLSVLNDLETEITLHLLFLRLLAASVENLCQVSKR